MDDIKYSEVKIIWSLWSDICSRYIWWVTVLYCAPSRPHVAQHFG